MWVESRRSDRNRKPLFDNHHLGGWFIRDSSVETGWWGQNINVASSQNLYQLWRDSGNFMVWNQVIKQANISSGKTAESFSGHGIIPTRFPPRMHGLSLVMRREQTDPGWATLQNETPALFPLKVLIDRGKLKEPVQIKRTHRDLTAKCNIWHWIVS